MADLHEKRFLSSTRSLLSTQRVQHSGLWGSCWGSLSACVLWSVWAFYVIFLIQPFLSILAAPETDQGTRRWEQRIWRHRGRCIPSPIGAFTCSALSCFSKMIPAFCLKRKAHLWQPNLASLPSQNNNGWIQQGCQCNAIPNNKSIKQYNIYNNTTWGSQD